MPFSLGCKFTLEYFGTGCLGGLVAVLILPGAYTALPGIRKINGEWSICWGALARVVVAGIAGCVVDCNTRNAFFGGFFAWHAFRWLGDDGWKWICGRLEKTICK